MKTITLPDLEPGFDRIRGITIRQGVMAVLVGDGAWTQSIRWLRISDGAELRRFTVPIFEGCADPAVSDDLSLVAYAEETERPGYPHIVLECPAEPALGKRQIQPLDPYGEGSGMTLGFRCLAFGADRATLRASLENGELTSWDIRNALGGQAPIPKMEYIMEEYPPVRCMVHGRPPSINGEEAYLIACEGAMIYLRRTESDASPLTLMAGYNYAANPLAAAFAPDGGSIAVAFPDRVILWGTEVFTRPPFRASVPIKSVQAMAFHPDGRLVTASEYGTVRLCNADGADLRSAGNWDVGRPSAMAFTADGRVCVLGGDSGKLAVREEMDLAPANTVPEAPPLEGAATPPGRVGPSIDLARALELYEQYRQRFHDAFAPVRQELADWFRKLFKKRKPTPRAQALYCRLDRPGTNRPVWQFCWDPGPHSRYWLFEPTNPMPAVLTETDVVAIGLVGSEVTDLTMQAYYDLAVDAWGEADGYHFSKPLYIPPGTFREPGSPRHWVDYTRDEIRKAAEGVRFADRS